ncbi:hypothetical protein [Bartonella sp. CL27QHWL]|uniref:hypothetical protein n=1 Tax=Bartonella sp. CL27QHWL TaxID=3243521 RepID=UPI0035D0FACB
MVSFFWCVKQPKVVYFVEFYAFRVLRAFVVFLSISLGILNGTELFKDFMGGALDGSFPRHCGGGVIAGS